MARVPYPDPKSLSPETQEQLGTLPPLNIFRMMAGGEGLLAAFVRLGNHLLTRSKLDPVLREIAILRVGALSKASYEVFQHERIGRRLGMSDALLAAIRRGPEDAALDDLQRLVVRFTDEVVQDVRASDRTFEPLRARLSLQELQELTVTIGYYMTACRFLENFDVELER
jgi:alkylhydroperoxidase family enzyme